MIKISEKRLLQLKKNFKGKRIAIIGDMMLDIYFWGDVKRISPEAPVPVLEVENEFYRFGGAANCAFNIASLKGKAEPIGVIGYDNYGTIFNSLLSEQNISHHGIIEDDTRPTTAKTRVIADSQHIVRIDKESKQIINQLIQNKILDYIKSIIKDLDGIILQDYNKGVLSAPLIAQVIELANKNKKLVTVDPKFNNFYEYKNVTVFKPNRKEAEDILGMKIKTDADVSFAGNTLLKKLNAKNILLTLGEGGIAVFEKGKPEKHMPTKARKVA
ncbi:MAG: PfkB family carbohydrate kinase, partial [Ignavibacteriaceae bacterium]